MPYMHVLCSDAQCALLYICLIFEVGVMLSQRGMQLHASKATWCMHIISACWICASFMHRLARTCRIFSLFAKWVLTAIFWHANCRTMHDIGASCFTAENAIYACFMLGCSMCTALHMPYFLKWDHAISESNAATCIKTLHGACILSQHAGYVQVS